MLSDSPSALSWPSSHSIARSRACGVAGLEGRASSVSTVFCSGGAAGTVRRSGFCCVSHGASALSGGRFCGFGGLAPSSGSGRRAVHAGLEGHEVLAAGGQHAEPLAVGVARAALAGEAGERLGRLLEDLALGGELLVRHRVLRPRLEHRGLAARGAADLAVERHAALHERREVRHRQAEVVGQPAQLRLGDEAAQLAHPRGGGVERGLRVLHAGPQLDRERAQRREGVVERGERRASPRAACAGARRRPPAGCRPRAANAPAATLKSVTSDLSCSRLRSSAAAVAPACLT